MYKNHLQYGRDDEKDKQDAEQLIPGYNRKIGIHFMCHDTHLIHTPGAILSSEVAAERENTFINR